MKENMKKRYVLLTMFLAFFLVAVPGSSDLFAKDAQVETVDVPLTNPGQPVSLVVGVMGDSVSVVGYSGKTVQVEIRPMKKKRTKRSMGKTRTRKRRKNERDVRH